MSVDGRKNIFKFSFWPRLTFSNFGKSAPTLRILKLDIKFFKIYLFLIYFFIISILKRYQSQIPYFYVIFNRKCQKMKKIKKKEKSNLNTSKMIPKFLSLIVTRKQEPNPEKMFSSYSVGIQAIKLKILLIWRMWKTSSKFLAGNLDSTMNLKLIVHFFKINYEEKKIMKRVTCCKNLKTCKLLWIKEDDMKSPTRGSSKDKISWIYMRNLKIKAFS